MLTSHHREEIDHRTTKFIVGVIALSLGNLTSFFASTRITSISASYYEGGWSQNIFIGFLYAISAFLMAYNGYSLLEMVLSKIAAVAALLIALFPCRCDTHDQIVPYVHGLSAAVMFGILTFFCYVFFRRARSKGETHARRRAAIYALCGFAMVASILTLVFDNLSGGLISSKVVRLTFYGERTALVAFGISWLAASHWLPVVASRTERAAAHNPSS